jgi:hypothetical protein
MSYSRISNWCGGVDDDRMAEYLLTWFGMWGMGIVTLYQACDVDDAIQDDGEYCWSVALAEKFIVGAVGKRRLSKKAIKFLEDRTK